MLVTNVVYSCLLAVKILFTERTSGSRFPTVVIIFGFLTVNLNITDFANMSLDHMRSHHCVIVYYMFYQVFLIIKFAPAGVALVF